MAIHLFKVDSVINDGSVPRWSLQSMTIRFERIVQIGANAFFITARGTR